MTEEDPTTEELRIAQTQRERDERTDADESTVDDEADQHERRADKAAYLREQLEKRAEAERESSRDD